MSVATIQVQLVRLIYGIYAWIALTGVAIPMMILLIFTPTRVARRQVARWCARLFFLLIGSPVQLKGSQKPLASPCIVIANHASYLDGMILTAALPPNFTFLIKHEMATLPLTGFLLRRIGSEFVDRNKDSHRKQVVRRLFRAAEEGDALAFFPEGTFDRTPGLRRFHLGAFSSARRAKLPIVPIVITGSRGKLPATSWICSPGPLSIQVCAPLYANTYTSVQEWVHASRKEMLKWLGEPDLASDEEL